MTLTAAGIQGADLSEPLVLFGIAIQNVPGKYSRKRPSPGSHSSQTRYAISLSYLDHLEIGEGGARILARVVVTTRNVCPGVPRRSRFVPQPILTLRIVNVQVPCLSLWSLKLGNRNSCSDARVSKRPPADLAIHYNTLRAAKEQSDVTSCIPCILSVARNWSIKRAELSTFIALVAQISKVYTL